MGSQQTGKIRLGLTPAFSTSNGSINDAWSKTLERCFLVFKPLLAYTNQVALGCIPQVLLGLCNFSPQSRICMVSTCLIKIVPCWLKRILKFPHCWPKRYPQWGTEETGCPLVLRPWSLRESWLATYFYGGGHWGLNKVGVELETVVVNSILPQPLCSIMFFSLLGPRVGEDVQSGLKERNAAHYGLTDLQSFQIPFV